MKILGAQEVAASLEYATLVDILEDAFRVGATVPPRHHHTISVQNEQDGTLLLMPAWNEAYMGVKTAIVIPGNAERGLPAVQANYQLMDRQTGKLLAILDGAELTARRTAAASALASRHLSRASSSRLLMVGTGTLAPHLIGAHATQRGIEEVQVWGRRIEQAKSVVATINLPGVQVRAVDNLKIAVAEADIISCATLANTPLIHGEWLRSGQHLDLVGGFTQGMREVDDVTITRARLFVDTDDAIETTGDIYEPLRRGIIKLGDIQGTLFSLSQGEASPARPVGDEITLFKSAGTAIEDLAGAVLAYERT